MSLILDDIILSLTNANERTPPQALKTTLSLLYEKSKQYGLSSPQLQALVRLLCETSIIDTVTKVYIVENCFLPDGYLTKELLLRLLTISVRQRYSLDIAYKRLRSYNLRCANG